MLPRYSVFVLRTDCELPEELISFARLLLLSEDEWAKTAKKSKLPKPKVDSDVLTMAIDVLNARLKEYPTSIEVSISAVSVMRHPNAPTPR